MERITITRPDDWHLHLRDGEVLPSVVPMSAQEFGRAVVMPNLRPPVTTVEQALAYRQRILAVLPEGSRFQPLMTLYLTDNTTADEIDRAAAEEHVVAVKLYPAGATTNSEAGVTDLERVSGVLEALQRHGMPLLVHGEVTDPAVDVFDREAVFIEQVLEPLLRRFQGLKVVLEHVTTRDGVDFVRGGPDRVAATVTPHHLLLDRNAIFAGGLRPHAYCLPVLKRRCHREALLEVVCSGHPRFFAGTDSAPHARTAKESDCGCAGIFSAHAALALYAEALDQARALDRLEAFTSHFGADFYGLPRNSGTLTLVRSPWQVPASYPFGQSEVVPLRASETLAWQVE